MKKFERIIRETVPTLVVFEKVGSQNASRTKHLLDDLRNSFADKAKIISVDASYDGDVKVKYNLQEFPTWVIFKEGQELMRDSGNKSQSDLEEMVKRAV